MNKNQISIEVDGWVSKLDSRNNLWYNAEIGDMTAGAGYQTFEEAQAMLKGEDEGVEIFKGEITGLNRKGMRE
jgi:hypothetical protein